MGKSRRSTYLWLMLLGAAVGAIGLSSILGGPIPSVIAIAITAAYVTLLVGVLTNLQLRRLQAQIPRITAAARMTSAAREATGRSGVRAFDPDTLLADVGLIVNERYDGQLHRRLAQVVSMDDPGVQPYVMLQTNRDSLSLNRVALVQFDIYDQAGQVRFSRTVQHFIREGENLVSCDRQLTFDALENVRAGVWDLRVTIDGLLAGVHGFTVNPSANQRRRQFTTEGEVQGMNLAMPAEDEALSLEELLREQRRSGSSRS